MKKHTALSTPFLAAFLAVFCLLTLIICLPAEAAKGAEGPAAAGPSSSKAVRDGGSVKKNFGNELHLAAMKGDVVEVRRLILAGADVKAKDAYGSTPLHLTHSADVINLLVKNGASVSARDTAGNTPLHRVASGEAANALMKKGAKVGARNNDVRTPLHLAAKNDAGDVAAALIAGGADVNAKDMEKRTPLHLAASKEMARLLIVKGARIDVKDANGVTPVMIPEDLKKKPSKKGDEKAGKEAPAAGVKSPSGRLPADK